MNKIFIIGFVFLFGCNEQSNISESKTSENEGKENVHSISRKEGRALLENNCYSCHNPSSESHDDMLAPPLAAIKYKYKQKYTSEDEFIDQMSDFVDSPTEEKAMMKGPVKRFGLMPKTALAKNEIKELIKYMYQNELEYPEWFPAHFEEQHDEKWDER